MATHLVEGGHRVRLVSYDRGYRNLKDDFEVFEVEGLSIAAQDNKVSVIKTVAENLGRLVQGERKFQDLRRALFKPALPDCVITDFEPMTAYLAHHYGLPLITIDNQHRMRYMESDEVPGMELDRQLTRAIIRGMVPRPDVSLVTTFFFGRVTNERTFLFPPILRREVLNSRAREGEHILVYVTQGFESLLKVLRGFSGESFRVYGSSGDSAGPLNFRPFSTTGFLDDLASAKAVIATAGFTLISEALYLGKPYLAVPMDGQFEQQLNAFQLQSLGYGQACLQPSADAVAEFLDRLPDFRLRLADYQAGDNSQIKAKLDELLADDCAAARRLHRS